MFLCYGHGYEWKDFRLVYRTHQGKVRSAETLPPRFYKRNLFTIQVDANDLKAAVSALGETFHYVNKDKYEIDIVFEASDEEATEEFTLAFDKQIKELKAAGVLRTGTHTAHEASSVYAWRPSETCEYSPIREVYAGKFRDENGEVRKFEPHPDWLNAAVYVADRCLMFYEDEERCKLLSSHWKTLYEGLKRDRVLEATTGQTPYWNKNKQAGESDLEFAMRIWNRIHTKELAFFKAFLKDFKPKKFPKPILLEGE